jgi:hypothetical protein
MHTLSSAFSRMAHLFTRITSALSPCTTVNVGSAAALRQRCDGCCATDQRQPARRGRSQSQRRSSGSRTSRETQSRRQASLSSSLTADCARKRTETAEDIGTRCDDAAMIAGQQSDTHTKHACMRDGWKGKEAHRRGLHHPPHTCCTSPSPSPSIPTAAMFIWDAVDVADVAGGVVGRRNSFSDGPERTLSSNSRRRCFSSASWS